MSRAIIFALLLPAACRPDLGPGDSLVTSPRILAIKADPPEAKPGTSAIYTALVAAPSGAIDDAPILWTFCTAPKPLTENNVVSSACLDAPSLVAAGAGPTVMATTPTNGCRVFGPDTPAATFRPRDPDVTGGYYQPLRADLAGVDPTFLPVRILCNLADAPAETAARYAAEYTPNLAPHLAPLTARTGGAEVSLDAIATGTRVELEASWPASDAESFAYFDRASQTLSTKREAMRVAWFANAGAFDTESTGRDEDDSATSTGNVWIAPRTGGNAHIWIVLRDNRGGVDFASYDLSIVP
jgi:hypothetical protein